MPVTVTWDDEEQTTLRYEFIAPWTWDDYRSAVERGWAEGHERPHLVHVIIDFRRMGTMPQGYLTHFSRTAITRIGSNTGLIIMVGVTGLLTRIRHLMVQLFPRLAKHVIHVGSIEEARAVIVSHIAKPDASE